MTWTRRTRRLHRGLSIVFTFGTVANFVAMRGGEQPPPYIGAMAAIPLMLLLATGLVLFVEPYVARLRGDGGPRLDASSRE